MLRWWYADADDRTPAESLAAHDVAPAVFERLLHRVATAMPSLDQAMSTWVPEAVAVLNQYRLPTKRRVPAPACRRRRAALFVAVLAADTAASQVRAGAV